MPKFTKAFRRKSSNNILDLYESSAPPTESSFRVFERPEHASRDRSFDGGIKLAKASGSRPTSSSLLMSDNLFEDMKNNRYSAASHTNNSSLRDDSSRFSATSTAPSSTELARSEAVTLIEALKFEKATPPPPTRPSQFSLKAAGRSFSSFSLSKSISPPSAKELDEYPLPHLKSETSPARPAPRQRAATETFTIPPLPVSSVKLGDSPVLTASSFGVDLSNMFSKIGKRQSRLMETEPASSLLPSPECTPPTTYVTSRSNNNRSTPPSPLALDPTSHAESTPYSWASRRSSDELMHDTSPIQRPSSPPPPPVPRHNSPPQARRELSSADGLRRSSAFALRRQSTLEIGGAEDEDARMLRESVSASRRLNNSPIENSPVGTSWVNANVTHSAPRVTGTPAPAPTSEIVEPETKEDDMFDVDAQLANSAILVERYQQRPPSPPPPPPSRNKVMTPAQFERYKQDQERLKSVGGTKDDDNDDEDIYNDDDEDETEKKREIITRRRKQEAHLAVYRQSMMKVTGETVPTPSLRPGMTVSHSAPNLNIHPASPTSEQEEDEDVPLGILAAHGFPNSSRAPGTLAGMTTKPSISVGGMASSTSLPVFARNLPQDPYLGASLVNATNRESLAFAGGAPSIAGTPRQPPPGGLVGVIASEERSRAMRRGSPNANGEYSSPGAASTTGMFSDTSSAHASHMPPVPLPQLQQLSPADQAQLQLTQQMSQFMQMQMQFMQTMAAPGPSSIAPPISPSPLPTRGPLAAPSTHRTSTTITLPPVPVTNGRLNMPAHQQRSMSSLSSRSPAWASGGLGQGMPHPEGGRQSPYATSIYGNKGYAPSIAPSERSNIGQPGRYRPVSIAPERATQKGRGVPLQAMSASRQNGGGAGGGATRSGIRVVGTNGNAKEKVARAEEDDDDDEAGWARMMQARAEKKRAWKGRKAGIGAEVEIGAVQF